MLILDSVANVALSVDDVCALDASRISNPVMFRKFAGGLRVDENFLLNDRWEKMPALNAPSLLFGAIMQEMLPVSYDAGWLEGLGGSFSIRITGVGEYTLISMSRRVVTLCGLPTDAVTNEQSADLEIAPEVMLAFCRGLLLEMADDVLADEDEFEDREISSAELLFNGMPSGGYDFGASIKDAQAGNIGFLNANAAATGSIEKAGDQDWFAVMLNAGVPYRIDLRGSGSGRGTLNDPMIHGIVSANGASMGLANDDAIGLESRIVFTPTNSGTYYIAAGAYSAGTGTYQLQVVNNAYTEPLLPSVEVGGDFASDITSARNERIGSVAINGMAKGTISTSGDRDWYAVTLSAGTTYRIDLRGAPTGRGTLTDPYLWAIYDSSPNPVDIFGNVRPDGVGRAMNDDSNGTVDSMVFFTPQRNDTYYIAAAGYSSSTGTYQLTVSTDTNGYALAWAGLPVLAVRLGLRHLQSLRLESQSLDTTLKIKRAFLDRLYARPTVFFDAHFAGELFGRLKDLDQCLRLSLRAHHSVVPQAIIAVASTAALFLIAPIIAILLIIPRVAIIGWMYVVSKRTHELELKIRDEGDRNRALQAQRAGGFLRFFAAGLQDHLLTTCLPGISRWQTARANYERRFITFRAFQRAIDTSSQPLAAFAGAYLMIAGQLTYGGFMLATALGLVLSTQLTELSDTFQKYRALGPVVRRVAEVVHEVDRDEGLAENQIILPEQPIEHRGADMLIADRLSFGYNGLDADLFANLNFAIKRREVVNVLGESGAGKSTLLDLLAGLRRPIAGGVYFEGIAVTDPISAGFVVADDEFVEGPLAAFVASGREIDIPRLVYVLKFVELWERLGFFVDGDGSERLEKQGLSRGEIQRLMLAQALYRSGECLIFDEAFTHLSLEQSVRILQRLRDLGTTVIMATHRPEIQSLCDRTISLSPQQGGQMPMETAPNGMTSRPPINRERFQ